jgi:hypothetical protein
VVVVLAGLEHNPTARPSAQTLLELGQNGNTTVLRRWAERTVGAAIEKRPMREGSLTGVSIIEQGNRWDVATEPSADSSQLPHRGKETQLRIPIGSPKEQTSKSPGKPKGAIYTRFFEVVANDNNVDDSRPRRANQVGQLGINELSILAPRRKSEWRG